MHRTVPLIAALLMAIAPACADLDTSEEEPLRSEVSGEVSLEWMITNGERLVSCSEAGAAEVEVAVLGDRESRQRVSCYGGFAVVVGLEAGSSLVEVSLVDPEGEYLVTADVGEVNIVGGATVPLGAVELSL